MAPKNKWTLTIHDHIEDPYYTISNGPITLAANCGLVGETDEDEDAIFKMVAGALNDSGIDFHSENKSELQQHLKIQQLEYENERLREALRIVQQWQLPSTGKFWDKEQTQPMSYGACYGSNGERDYMKAIANDALSFKSNDNGTTENNNR